MVGYYDVTFCKKICTDRIVYSFSYVIHILLHRDKWGCNRQGCIIILSVAGQGAKMTFLACAVAIDTVEVWEHVWWRIINLFYVGRVGDDAIWSEWFQDWIIIVRNAIQHWNWYDLFILICGLHVGVKKSEMDEELYSYIFLYKFKANFLANHNRDCWVKPLESSDCADSRDMSMLSVWSQLHK